MEDGHWHKIAVSLDTKVASDDPVQWRQVLYWKRRMTEQNVAGVVI